MATKLGDRIKALREEQQVGVRELGRRVDVSAMHISNIEKANLQPVQRSFRKLLQHSQPMLMSC